MSHHLSHHLEKHGPDLDRLPTVTVHLSHPLLVGFERGEELLPGFLVEGYIGEVGPFYHPFLGDVDGVALVIQSLLVQLLRVLGGRRG